MDIAVGVTKIAATAATTTVQVMGAVKAQELAEEQAELQMDLAQQRMDIEKAMAESQRNIVDIQAEGLQKSQDIAMTVQTAEAALRRAQVERELAKERLATKLELQEMMRTGAGATTEKPVEKSPALVAVAAIVLSYVIYQVTRKGA